MLSSLSQTEFKPALQRLASDKQLVFLNQQCQHNNWKVRCYYTNYDGIWHCTMVLSRITQGDFSEEISETKSFNTTRKSAKRAAAALMIEHISAHQDVLLEANVIGFVNLHGVRFITCRH